MTLACGIDIGTTNLKVVLLDEGNRLLWRRVVPAPRAADDFGPVTEAARLAEAIGGMIAAGWRETGGSRRIGAISAAGVGEDGVCAGAACEPLGPAIPWSDLRAAEEAAELASGPAATPRAGLAIEPARTAAKWLWLARHAGTQVAAAQAWIALTDYPLARWAGVPFISDTLAARTGAFDPFAGEWIEPLLAASRAPPLPRIVRAGTVVGRVRDPGLLATGAVDGDTLLVAGGHDHPVAASALRGLLAGARVDSLGTANVICGEAPAFEPTDFDPLVAFAPPVGAGGGIGCLSVFEFTAEVGRLPGGVGAMRRALTAPRLPGGPGDGAAPRAGPARSGRFTGERALLEWATGNALRMLERQRRYGVQGGPIAATGGWSRSRALVELRASIFGEPVHVPDEPELAAVGAALIASAALGRTDRFETGFSVVEPVPEWREGYAGLRGALGGPAP